MKLSLSSIATLSTFILSALVRAREETPSLRRVNNGAKNYFAIISAGTQDEEIPGCMASALGNVIAMVRDDMFCVKLSYDDLDSPELFTHAVHGPAAVGETGPVIFTLDTNTDKRQCFQLTKDQIKDLDDELWYFNVRSDMFLNSAVRGQILPLVSNVNNIVKQLRQRPTFEAVKFVAMGA